MSASCLSTHGLDARPPTFEGVYGFFPEQLGQREASGVTQDAQH